MNYNDKNHEKIVIKAVKIIKNGGIALLPFDTVYGFICDPRNENALENIYELKKRPAQKTIGLATCCVDEIARYTELNKQNRDFIKERTPGKFTFILKKKEDTKLSNFCVQNGTIGIRIPNSEFILDIAKLSGGIIAQTSANISGQSNCFSPKDFLNQYKNQDLQKIDLIVDGGVLDSSSSSRLFDLTGEIAKEMHWLR